MSDPQPAAEGIDAAPGKISIGSEGLGTPTPELLEQRALELARTDGRSEANEADRHQALADLLGPSGVSTPEADPEVEEVTVWDESPDIHGVQTPRVLPEDEANIAVTLVEEGLDEADHNSRLQAAEANPPEEEEI